MALIFLGSAFNALAEPSIQIITAQHKHVVSVTDLLANKALREIEIKNDVAYQKAMKFVGLPLHTLLPDLPKDASLQFIAIDGFVANIPVASLQGKGQPYLAIEPLDKPWPALKAGSALTAGPFYLVWLTPEKAGITNEQWPYQIAIIAESAPLSERYPQIRPSPRANAAALRGLQVYMTNCSVCHTINGGGDAELGPDLNRPHNPTEYFQEAYLRKLIRQPSAVRTWKQSVMPGFNTGALAESDLNDLLAYLKAMAQQR